MQEGSSLLAYVDTPAFVGDPDGRIVYANPAFEKLFKIEQSQIMGKELSSIFQGGSREDILQAIAEVCAKRRTVRFRLRELGIGYSAIASAIESGGEGVGAVILLTESPIGDEKLVGFIRELMNPIDVIEQCLDELEKVEVVQAQAQYDNIVLDAARAIQELKRWSSSVAQVPTKEGVGSTPAEEGRPETIEVARILQEVVSNLDSEIKSRQLNFEAILPAELPLISGDARDFEAAVCELLLARMSAATAKSWITLKAKKIGHGRTAALLIELTDVSTAESSIAVIESKRAETPLIRSTVEKLGGQMRTTADPIAGRTVTIQFPLVE